jgi:ATP-binding cassette subfamily F protein 3
MFDPKTAEPRFAKLAVGDLMKRRADIQAQIEAAEAVWLEATEALEAA